MASAVVVAASAVVCACGGAKYPESGEGAHVVVRIERVTVSASRPGSSHPWDASIPDRSGVGCSLMAFVARQVEPVVGDGIGYLCALDRPSQAQRSPDNPDLLVRLSTANGGKFETFVAPDALDHVFDYEFVVPMAAVPPEGLRLEVLDADAAAGAELIGLRRITAPTLEHALDAEAPLDLAEGAVQHLEVRVRPYEPMKLARSRQAASDRPRVVGARSVIAGEMVSLRATGSYTVGSYYDRLIGPAGYPKGEAMSYNVKQAPFASSPHACGLALVGSQGRYGGAAVAPDATFLALYAGPLQVGVNDTEPSNNDGWIAFEGQTRAPSPKEWLGTR